MNLQSLTCPHCGAVLNITTSTKVVHCDFCDSDIMIEQSHNQQQYSQSMQNPNSQFVTRNEMPMQQYQNFPPSQLFDQAAFQKWKKKFWGCHSALLLSVFIFVIIVVQNPHSDAAVLPFLIALLLFIAAPIVLAFIKPDEPDYKKNRKGWNVFKYYLMFAGNILLSFVGSAIIAGALGLI